MTREVSPVKVIRFLGGEQLQNGERTGVVRGEEKELLLEMRRYFIGERTVQLPPYWKSEAYLAAYERFFAQRIAWKWRAVFADMESISLPSSDARLLLDWGCGTGVASREFLASRFRGAVDSVLLYDHSSLATNFAARKISDLYKEISIEKLTGKLSIPSEPFILIISHVLTEIDQSALSNLIDLATKAARVYWVDAGTFDCSRKLVDVRNLMLKSHFPLAPCPHAHLCALNSSGASKDWCHFPARPPREAFSDPVWMKVMAELGIDQRSLPLSFLVMERGSCVELAERCRVLGRTRCGKAGAYTTLCTKESVRSILLEKRRFPEIVRALAGSEAPWHISEAEIDTALNKGIS